MYNGENKGYFPGPATHLARQNASMFGLRGESLYPDYWNDVSIALCPSDPRADTDGYEIEQDWGEQIQNVTGSGELAEVCRGALLSVPVSYIYMAHATQNMAEFLDASRMVTQSRWQGMGSGVYNETFFPEGQRATLYTEDQMEQGGCPRWTAAVTHWDGDVSAGDAFDTQYASNGRSNISGALGDQATLDAFGLPYSYPQLKEGVERFFITDINNPASGAQAQSTIAVMWDAWGGQVPASLSSGGPSGLVNGTVRFNHIPGGGNALFMDGHVEFIRFKSGYPVSNINPITGGLADEAGYDAISLNMTRAGGYG
jgi:prepilin-type processing-associated H-X9-DG protein